MFRNFSPIIKFVQGITMLDGDWKTADVLRTFNSFGYSTRKLYLIEDRGQTDRGRTDGGDYITSRANAVGNYWSYIFQSVKF